MSDYASVAATTTPITLTEAKTHLNVSSTNDDGYITSLIAAATAMLENRTSRCFITQTRVCKFDDITDGRYIHDNVLYLPRSPLKSVTSVKYVDSAGTTQTMPSSDYVAMTGDQPGRISLAYNASWPTYRTQPNSIYVTYVAGHSSVNSGIPANVKHAVKMTVAHWYRNREATIIGTISKEIELGVDALLESEHQEPYG